LTYFAIYGVLALTHIVVQLALGHVEYVASRRRMRREESGYGRPLTVTVVVPVYNEEPALLRPCLESIAGQDHRPLEVIVVDDGSCANDQRSEVYATYEGRPGWTILREPVNRGKRMAQKRAFDRATGEVIVTIDSDTRLRTPDAIRRIQRRFADFRVGAVTGTVGVENRGRNLLTRLIAARYWMAFNQERAAQSLFGVTMCCSGPFSAYRGDLVRALKEEYVAQTFFGESCTFGDDRHLTNLILRDGHRVVYDHHAHARTNVPETLPSYLRQQVRWNKSFYREALWTARFAHRRNPYLAFDLVLQSILPFMLMVALAGVAVQAVGDPTILWRWLAVLGAIALLRSSYGLLRTGDPGFLVFVVYGFLHVALLIPTRLYALATLRRNHWGSRADSPVVLGPVTIPRGFVVRRTLLYPMLLLIALFATVRR
jgi:hyaluronan synthase/N-acetylglucosaminyltransferase